MALTNTQIIIALIANLFSGYLICIFMRAFFGQKGQNLLLEWVSFCGYALVISLLYFIWNTPNIMLLANALLYLLLTFHYQAAMKARLVAAAMIIVIRLAAETLVLEFLQWLNYGDFASFNNAQYLLTQVLIGLVSYLAVFIFAHIKQTKTDALLPWTHWAALILVPIFISMPLAIYGRTISPEYAAVMMVMTILLTMVIVALFYLYNYLLQSYQDKIDKELLLQQNNAYSKQLELIDESNAQTRFLLHDWKRHTQILAKLLEQSDIAEVRRYVQDMQDSITEQSSRLVSSGNTIIDAIFNLKIAEAERKQIDLRLDAQIPEKLEIAAFDLNVILSNLLDNAIEAVEQNDAQRWIILTLYYHLHMIDLTIKNPYHTDPIEQNGHFITNKADKDNHGLGLQSVYRTLQKYSGSDIDITHGQGQFTVKVYLYDQPPEKK